MEEEQQNNSWSDRSNTLTKLITALNKVQAEMETAKKNADNPFFKSKYADLAEVHSVTKKPLAKNGFAVSQVTAYLEEKLVLRTLLMHESGEYISSVLPIVETSNPQKMGVWITYCRRYALQSIVGLPSEDDDGEGAMNRNTHEVPHNEARRNFEKAMNRNTHEVPHNEARRNFEKAMNRNTHEVPQPSKQQITQKQFEEKIEVEFNLCKNLKEVETLASLVWGQYYFPEPFLSNLKKLVEAGKAHFK